MSIFDPGNFTPHYVANLCNALSDLGVQVNLITSVPLFEQTVVHESVRVDNHFFKVTAGSRTSFFRRHAMLRRAFKALGYPPGLWRTWHALRSRSPGTLHVQWSLVPVLDALLFRKLRAKGWRIVYTAREAGSELDEPIRRWLFRHILRETDAVIVHTPGLARRLRDDSGDVLREVCEIPEGISTFPLSPGVDRNEARRVLGLEPEGPLLLFFGMIKRYKGLEYLLRAWPRVIAEFPNARLLIAGEAMLSMRYFDDLIDTLKIRDSIVLKLGYVPRSEAQYYFCAADAVVLPYARISTSGVVPLAYRYARAVIATTAGALPEIVIDGQTGFLVAPQAEHPLAEAICRGFRNPQRLANMGVHAQEWFERDRHWNDIARQTAALNSSAAAEKMVAARV